MRYIISLGSNLPSGSVEIERAIRYISRIASVTATTPTYHTPDSRNPDAPQYTNAIVAVDCNHVTEDFIRLLKAYEVANGRKQGCKDIPIDLDLVCRDTEILRPRDFNAHYFVEGIYRLKRVSMSDKS